MRKTLIAISAAVSIAASSASAVTFPSLTTIYVGAGVVDDGVAVEDLGIATSFNCSNISGVAASVRFFVPNAQGTGVEASVTTTIPHGGTRTASTHHEETFIADIDLDTGAVGQGLININRPNLAFSAMPLSPTPLLVAAVSLFLSCGLMLTQAQWNNNALNRPPRAFPVAKCPASQRTPGGPA